VTQRRSGARLCDARGVILVEFLIAFLPVFLLFLAIVQLVLLAAARLIVQHAAEVGVRAAIVVLDDASRFYSGAVSFSLSDAAGSQPDWEQRFTERFGAPGPASNAATREDGARMAAIRRAVHARIAAIAPDPSFVAQLRRPASRSSTGAAIGTRPLARVAFALDWYAGVSTAVTFPVTRGSAQLQTAAVMPRSDVTLRVTHLFACRVPIVAGLLCARLHWNRSERRLARGTGVSAREALRELQLAPLAADQEQLARAPIAFAILRAEATLPAQNARYAGVVQETP
jgi:Flp pilus assembly protein TadG